MFNHAAGPFAFYVCPNQKCKKRVKIFNRSFIAQGKKCPECKVLIPSMNWDEKTKTFIRNKLKLHRNQKE